MGHRYYICDVFTDTRFGGNQLAVLPEAHGLSDRQMQQVAREFTVTFEEKAGLVPIAIHRRQGTLWCQLSAPERLSLGKTVPADVVAAAVSLAPDDVVLTTHQPQVASVGLPFLVTELKDRSALERARVSGSGVDALVARGIVPDVHLYTRSGDELEIRRGCSPHSMEYRKIPPPAARAARSRDCSATWGRDRHDLVAHRPGCGDGTAECPGSRRRETGRGGRGHSGRRSERAGERGHHRSGLVLRDSAAGHSFIWDSHRKQP